jgi:hypothetical protein
LPSAANAALRLSIGHPRTPARAGDCAYGRASDEIARELIRSCERRHQPPGLDQPATSRPMPMATPLPLSAAWIICS